MRRDPVRKADVFSPSSSLCSTLCRFVLLVYREDNNPTLRRASVCILDRRCRFRASSFFLPSRSLCHFCISTRQVTSLDLFSFPWQLSQCSSFPVSSTSTDNARRRNSKANSTVPRDIRRHSLVLRDQRKQMRAVFVLENLFQLSWRISSSRRIETWREDLVICDWSAHVCVCVFSFRTTVFFFFFFFRFSFKYLERSRRSTTSGENQCCEQRIDEFFPLLIFLMVWDVFSLSD